MSKFTDYVVLSKFADYADDEESADCATRRFALDVIQKGNARSGGDQSRVGRRRVKHGVPAPFRLSRLFAFAPSDQT